MRKLKIMEHISLDGVIQSTGEDGFPYTDWTAPYRSPAGRDALLATHGTHYDLLLGRRTYDMWSGVWPNAPASPMGDSIKAATKYVVTNRPESLEWGPYEAVEDEVEGVRRIKSDGSKDILLWGSSTLTSTLLEHGLVDEMVLIVYPVLIGTGKRFFAEGSPARSFSLVGSSTTPTGVMLNKYEFVGPLKGG
ncbi:dihydrofolate reductase family protein [Rhodanobacter sp. L36]|uniref:dihydrofolate reductase family protein n=1 Tax=Rhodanobacter sp. L36 TaxID=1747221 RepID=UPI00131A64B3|nr:dihydrofolate reductase family protein [Rhodanobacter sp. L36]